MNDAVTRLTTAICMTASLLSFLDHHKKVQKITQAAKNNIP